MFLTPTCRFKRNHMILCHTRKAWWSWAEISSILEMLQIMWRNRSNLRKPPKKWRMEGESTFLFKGKKKKKIFHSSILFIFSYHLIEESSYISWFTWYLWKFLLQLENAKWLAASPIAKGITALTNNQQSKALNINFKTKNPNDNG